MDIMPIREDLITIYKVRCKNTKNYNKKNFNFERNNKLIIYQFISSLKYIFLYFNIINLSINIIVEYNLQLFKRKIEYDNLDIIILDSLVNNISKYKPIKPYLRRLDIIINNKFYNIFPENLHFNKTILDILNKKNSIKYKFKEAKFSFFKTIIKNDILLIYHNKDDKWILKYKKNKKNCNKKLKVNKKSTKLDKDETYNKKLNNNLKKIKKMIIIIIIMLKN